MTCVHCGEEVAEGLSFCNYCHRSIHETKPTTPKISKILKPKTAFEFILIGVILVAIGFWGYKQTQKAEVKKEIFDIPEEIDGDLVRIHRSAEEEEAGKIAQRWQSRGYQKCIAAVYEFSITPYKPIFYLGAANGSGTDQQKILEEEIEIFEGEMGATDKIAEFSRDGTAFLCASFQRGRGLHALSAICVWDDGKTSGFGVRVAGGAIEDTLRYTSEARKAISNPSPQLPFLEERPIRANRLESERNRTVRDIVASLKSYDCERFYGYLPTGAEFMLRQYIGEELKDTMKDPLERVCFVLSTINFPRSETMVILTDSESSERCSLILRASDRSGKDVEFPLVKTSEGWRVDADWALKQVQDHQVKLLLWQFPSDVERVKLRTDDARLQQSFNRGIADSFSEPGKVYAEISSDSHFVCGSARSHSGEYFMIRFDEKHVASYTRGSYLPTECPMEALSPSW